MKKILAMILCVVMVMSLATMAFAAEGASSVTPGTGYKIYADNGANKLWFNGSISSGRFDATTNEADAAIVYVDEVTGGYVLYMLNNDVKTYINMADKSAGASTTTDASAATVYEWDSSLKTLVVADDENARAFGSQENSTYMNFSCYAISNTSGYVWGQYIPASSDAPVTPPETDPTTPPETDPTTPPETDPTTPPETDPVTPPAGETLSGEYHLVWTHGGVSYAASHEANASNKLIAVENGENAPIWTIAPCGTGISLHNSNGYLAYTSGTNVVYQEEPYQWNLEKQDDGTYFIVASTGTTRALSIRDYRDKEGCYIVGAYALSNLTNGYGEDYAFHCTIAQVASVSPDPENPKDGDMISVIVALMAVSACGIAIIGKKKF